MICCLCGAYISNPALSNNPYPLADDGVCCIDCNTERVIPARVGAALGGRHVEE